jgi:hypothetical protein
MAERRMFAKTIIDSDAFLDMPISARLLYYDLGMRADDDGFINAPRKIMKMIGATIDDMNILIARKFVIPFDSGVVVIKAWRINNYLRSDRYNETKYLEEKAKLTIDQNGMYHTVKGNEVDSGIPGGIPTVSTGKVSIGKDSIGNNIGRTKFTPPTLEEVEAYCKERGNKVNPKAFFDYFTTGGWKDSKGNPVKNWKQKIITWEKFETQPKPKENKFNQMIHTNYDFDDIERRLLQQ